MSDLLQKIHTYLQYDLGNFGIAVKALPAAFITALIYWFVRSKRQKRQLGYSFKTARKSARLNEIIRALLVMWAAEVACITLFPIWFWNSVWNLLIFRISDFGFMFRSMTFQPWRLIPTLWYMITEPDVFGDLKLNIILEMLANVALFVPLGLGLPFVLKRESFVKTFLIGFACTFFIELVQPFISRTGSIDDIISNSLGTVIGYLLYLVIKAMFPRFVQKGKMTVYSTK